MRFLKLHRLSRSLHKLTPEGPTIITAQSTIAYAYIANRLSRWLMVFSFLFSSSCTLSAQGRSSLHAKNAKASLPLVLALNFPKETYLHLI